MHIGPYTLTALETGDFALDGGAMFGVVPKSLWSRHIGVDDKNRIDMKLRILLLEGAGKKILIDTGAGTKWDEKLSTIYRIDHATFELERSLGAHHLTCNDITDVILTHLHFDHAGGATKRNASGDIVPTFPNARYYVQQKNFEWALKPTEKDRASYLTRDFMPLKEAGQLEFLDGPGELFPGIELQIFHGHTAWQQLPKISDGEKSLFFCADLVPTSVHLPLPWIMAYDNQPLVTLEEKRRVLKQATDEKWLLFFEHCPHMAACVPVMTEKGYVAGERVNTL